MLTSVRLERMNEADNIGVYCSHLHEQTRAESKDIFNFRSPAQPPTALTLALRVTLRHFGQQRSVRRRPSGRSWLGG
jgi:hypothetical protein